MGKTSFKAKIIFETKKRPSYFEFEETGNGKISPITYMTIWEQIKNGEMEIKEIIADELTKDFEPIIIIGDKNG
jgi:hypothetical protein